MLIQCTKKLFDELGIKPENPAEEDQDLLFAWHANVITINRRKAVVLVNDKNRYVVVLYGLKAKDFKKLDEIIVQAIRETFQEEGIKPEIIDQYLNQSGEVTYTKTKDRTSVNRMNKSIDPIPHFEKFLSKNSLIQKELSLKISSLKVGDVKGNYKDPNEEMYKALEQLAGEPVFSLKAAVLKVTLNLPNHSVWRKLVVPVHMSFRHFHEVLQRAFEWSDEHLYEFYIWKTSSHQKVSSKKIGTSKESEKVLLSLVKEDWEPYEIEKDIPRDLASEVTLSDYLPCKITYIYDLGDYWEHEIEIENTVENYDKNYPICVDGEGATPPENVGGAPGYEFYLEVLADTNHPEHQAMKRWEKEYGVKEFDRESINRWLKY